MTTGMNAALAEQLAFAWQDWQPIGKESIPMTTTNAALAGIVLMLAASGCGTRPSESASTQTVRPESHEAQPAKEAHPVPDAPSTAGPRLALELRDGSLLIGQCLDDRLTAHSTLLGQMQLPWSEIRSVEFDGQSTNPGFARLKDDQGDSLPVNFITTSLSLNTIFGRRELPLSAIAKITLSPPLYSLAAASSAGCRLIVELRDGSRLIGEAAEDKPAFKSPRLGDVKLAWASIRAMDFTNADRILAELSTANGDHFDARLAEPVLGLRTIFGKASLPPDLIQSIRVSRFGDLEHCWPLAEDAKDMVGTNDGTLNGGVRKNTEEAGRGYYFDGNGANINFGPHVGNVGTNDFTIAVWIKTSYPGVECFLAKRAECNDATCLNITFGGGSEPGMVVCGLNDGNAAHHSEIKGRERVNDGHWHHVALVREAIAQEHCALTIYVDGVVDAESRGLYLTDMNNTADLVLGINPCDRRDGTEHFTGSAADLEIWSRALTDAEVAAIFQRGRQP